MRPEQDQEPDEMKAVLCSCDRVGRDAAGIVVGNHDNDAGAGDQHKKTDHLPKFSCTCSKAEKKGSRFQPL